MYKYTTRIGDIYKIRNLDHPISKTKSHSGNFLFDLLNFSILAIMRVPGTSG